MRDAWLAWIEEVMPALSRGMRVMTPTELGHPKGAGFSRLRAAQNAGQVADWGLSLEDGSRVHVHEYASGALVAHRDRHDPGRGLVKAVRHVATETRIGRVASVAGLSWAVSKILGGGA